MPEARPATRLLALLCSLLLTTVVGTGDRAGATQQPLTWELANVFHGDADGRGVESGMITILAEQADDFGGSVLLRVGGDDSCPQRSQEYLLTWTFENEITPVVMNDVIYVRLTNERVDGNACNLPPGEIAPYMRAAGSDGWGSPILERTGLTFGPNQLTDGGGGIFYSFDHPFHVPGVREIRIKENLGALPLRGWFQIQIEQRWGFNYEAAYVYELINPPQ
jgi:hypothetical protein